MVPNKKNGHVLRQFLTIFVNVPTAPAMPSGKTKTTMMSNIPNAELRPTVHRDATSSRPTNAKAPKTGPRKCRVPPNTVAKTSCAEKIQ